MGGIGLRHYDIAGAALDAFRTIDDSMRANRRDKALEEERAFQRERQTKADARTEEEFQWLKDDREIKQADDELGLMYADWKAGKAINPSERARRRMAQLGVELPLGPGDPDEAMVKGAVSDQLLGVINKRKAELDQIPTGTTIPAGEIGQALVKLDPVRYSKTYTDDQGEYRVQPSQLYLMRPGNKTSFALGMGVLRKDDAGQWVETGQIVPATKGQSNGADDQVSVISLDDLTDKLQKTSEFNRFYLDSMGTVENYLALKGNKQAGEAVTEKKSLSKVTAFKASDKYMALQKELPDYVQAIDGMVASGLLDANKYGEAMVKVGEEARKLKREGEEGKQANTLLGVMLKAKTKDEMGAVLVEYGGRLKQGAVDKAVTAYEKVTKSFSRDEMNEIRLQIAEMRGATRAGGGSGEGSTAMIKNAEFMVRRGIAQNYQEAYQMLNTAKDNPEALVKTLVSEGIKNNALLPFDQQKTPKQIAQEARSVVQELYGGQGQPQPLGPQSGITKFDEALLLDQASPGGPRRGMAAAPKPGSSRGATGLNSFYR